MKNPTASLVRCSLVLGLLLAPVACGAPQKHKVTVMVPWTNDEFHAFYKVVKDFERRNPHIDVEPQVTRALTQQLDAAVAADAEPDLAVLPSVGALTADKAGALHQLKVDNMDAYAEPFRGLGMKNGDVYAVPVKADVKSLFWYDTTVTSRPPEGWGALRLQSPPARWCLGLESGPVSGWPGADSIADILLADGGVGAYEDWVSGNARWEKGPVEDAWTAWGNLMGDSLKGASALPFDKTAARMAGRKCEVGHGALAAMAFDSAGVSIGRYAYVLSSRDALQVSADFVGKFTDNPYADEFISYLASDQAQQTWVDAPGFAISANTKVTNYANPVQGRIAEMLRSSRHTLCFTAADAMDPDVSAAFYRAVLSYANGKEQAPLLAALTKVQNELDQPDQGPPPESLCD